MAEKNVTTEKKPIDNSANKSKVLETLFDAIKQAEMLSYSELSLAWESLRVASLEAKKRDELERERKRAELEAKQRAEEEARRRAAFERAAKLEEKKRRAHAKEVTCMDLPMDWHSSYEKDERANVHFDSISDAFLFCLETLGEVILSSSQPSPEKSARKSFLN